MVETILYCEYNKVREAFRQYFEPNNEGNDSILLEFEDWVTENDAWDDHFWVEAEDGYPASAFTNFFYDNDWKGELYGRDEIKILVKFGGRPK